MQDATTLITQANHIIVIQAENPDGDSLGSSIALEEILSELGKKVTLYCPIDIPSYLRYIDGWDRIVDTFDTSADLAVIVDTNADVLLTKVLESAGVRHFLETHNVLVIDHHTTTTNLSFEHTMLSQEVVATSEVIYNLAAANNWTITAQAAQAMLAALLSDSLGLTTQSVSPTSYYTAAKLTEHGASPSEVEAKRREYMKKSREIFTYKGELIQRVEFYLDGKLALVHIPWEDIQQYSNQFNPSVLVLDEMRLVEDVELAIAIKTYPDGKLTGKLRGNSPVADVVAGYFGGGGHAYSAGFRVYEEYDKIVQEVLKATSDALQAKNND